MATAGSPEEEQAPSGDMWRGVDLSGVTLVLGAGTGRLIELLTRGAAEARGQVLVLSQRSASLQALAPLKGAGPLTFAAGRSHQIPALDETADLIVLNGVLREAPLSRYESFLDEVWRVLVPGGQLRVSDIVEPSDARHDRAWAARNMLVRRLGEALGRPTALAADLKRLALALRAVGFEGLSLSLLPGYVLTDAWLQETVGAVHTMAGQVARRELRDEILGEGLSGLIAAYRSGDQRAAQRFVLQGRKPGDLGLDMRASFTEEDLVDVD